MYKPAGSLSKKQQRNTNARPSLCLWFALPSHRRRLFFSFARLNNQACREYQDRHWCHVLLQRIKKQSRVSGGEGPSLVPCSSSKDKKHVIIYYLEYDDNGRLRGTLVCLPVDDLLSEAKPPCKIFKLFLPCSEDEQKDLNELVGCICTSDGPEKTSPGPCLYFFGGVDSPPDKCDWKFDRVMKKVYRYDLHKLPEEEVGEFVRCEDMKSGMGIPLLAQIGDDCIYLLSCGKTRDDDILKPAFQQYNFKENRWNLLNNDHFFYMIGKCDCDKQVRRNIGEVPHVVIGGKLHISVGNSAFTFDPENGAWEDCKLFKHFWSKQKEKKSGLSPLDFYGREVTKKRIRKRKRKSGGGPPFGFYGRGILWDKNILLGVRYAVNCPLVAFMLDEKSGRVVKSQRISLDNLVHDKMLRDGARLLDLGQDGYFGLLHMLPDFENYDYLEGLKLCMELVTFQVQKIGAPPDNSGIDYDDDAHFLKCEVVRKEIVAKGLPGSIGLVYNAFCV